MFTSVAVALLIIVIVSALFYSRQKHNYWSNLGVWSPSCLPFIGHLIPLFFKKDRWEYIDKIYVVHKEKKYWGMYLNTSPNLFVVDTDLIKHILVKDSDSFVDRTTFEIGEEDNTLKEFLTILSGEKWKALRNILSPTFSSGKIKGTFPLVSESVEKLLEKCDKKMEEDGHVEMKEMLGLYTMDVITNCAFGIDINCFNDTNSTFMKSCYDVMNPNLGDALKIMIYFISKKLFYALGFSLMKKSFKTLEKSVQETVKARQEAGIKRGDFLDLMMDALKAHEESTEPKEHKYPMTMNTVISSSILFLLAGYDTTANALSFAIYLLAKHTECQDELRKELHKLQEANGEISYRNIMEAKYMDACFSEALRMYGPAHFMERKCTRDYKLPSSNLVIKNGMSVTIPTWSLHYDPQYWEDPQKFNPDRFLPENKHKINQYAYLPFGHGPRNCIGSRFALLESKMVLAHLVLKYEISLKPGFVVKLYAGPAQTVRADSNGVQVILEPLTNSNVVSSDNDSDRDQQVE